MYIEILQIGQRLVRDARIMTHITLVSRAFNASKIYMADINPDIRSTIKKINIEWGGNFQIEFINNWKKIIKLKKSEGYKIIHLTMYGENINKFNKKIFNKKKIIVIVGASKVPRETYNIADYNIAIGNQPHSEISALAVFLDRIQKGKQLSIMFNNAKKIIIPHKNGKEVINNVINK